MADLVGQVRYDAEIDLTKLRSSGAQAEKIAHDTGDGIAKGIEGGTNKADAAFQKFSSTLKTGLIAGGVAAAAGLAVAIKGAMTFESSLSQLAQASGATGAQMDGMSTLARQLGKDTDLAGVTASDAAKAMVELSKAGLSVKDTMDASKGVLSLARAGNIDFADAAVIAASALNAFALEGKDATMVADTLAAGANASQADLSDLAMGMQQSATVAKQFGLSLNETVTALSLFANNGIRGSDAGTSLKTMLISLASPSTKAAAAMKDLGFNAYDASGQFVGLEEMSKRLNKATEKLTDQQKQNALATIFGTDAFRAAAVLADNAGESYSGMAREVGKAGAAQKAAAAQMGGFQRATENLDNAFADMGLTVGNYLLPKATQATNAFAGLINKLSDGIPGAIQTFMGLLPAVTGVTATVATYAGAIYTARAAVTALAVAQGALNAAMRMNPFLLLASLAAGVVASYFTLSAQSDSTGSAHERLKAAQDRLRFTTDGLKDANDRLSGAHLTLQGAQLQVESATNRYTESLKLNGANSLITRQAQHDLEQAKWNLKRATDEVAVATQNQTTKERENADAVKQFEEAAGRKAGSAKVVNEALKTQKDKLQDVDKWVNNLNGKTYTYTVEQWLKTLDKTPNKGPTIPIGRASGGPVSANKPYFVGDNPDGSLNKTSELFIPNRSGHIVNSKDLQAALQGQSTSSSGEITKIIQNNNIYNDIDLDVASRQLAYQVARG